LEPAYAVGIDAQTATAKSENAIGPVTLCVHSWACERPIAGSGAIQKQTMESEWRQELLQHDRLPLRPEPEVERGLRSCWMSAAVEMDQH
jgi:hypothetical protein